MATLTEGQDEASPHPTTLLNLIGSIEGLCPTPTSRWHSPISVPVSERVARTAGV